ncbi:MAG: hypothetical protein ACKVQR_18550 [Aquabacterium sp.]
MGKEHDQWMGGLGLDVDAIKVAEGGTSVSVKKVEGGDALNVKKEIKKDLAKKTFLVGPVPCYVKATVKAAIEGEVALTQNQKREGKASFKVNGSVAGVLELGVGAAVDGLTAGPFGSAELSANLGLQVNYTRAKGFYVDPLQVVIKGTGKVGIKIEVDDTDPKISISAESKLADWELYVIELADWKDNWFNHITWREGKDLLRLIAMLQTPGPAISAAVEKYAPKAVKEAAVDAAKWAAESDKAKAIADIVGGGLEQFKKTTGVDAGGKIEEVVAYLVRDSKDDETSAQTTARIEKNMEMLNATGEQFAKVMTTLQMWPDQALGRHRSAAEWNAVQAALETDRDRMLRGEAPTGGWVDMAQALAKTAAERKHAAEQKAKAAKKAAEDEEAAKLAERVKQAMSNMEAVRLKAMSPGNGLNNKTTKDTSLVKGRKFWEQGMTKFWTPSELERNKIGALQGQAKIDKANQLAAQYAKAREVFLAGLAMT